MIRNIHHDFLEPKVTNYLFNCDQQSRIQRFSNWRFFTDKESVGMGLEGFSPVVAAVQLRSSRPWRTSPRTSESSGTRGWWWWLELGSARRVASQISGKTIRYGFIAGNGKYQVNCRSLVTDFPHRSPGSGLYDNLQQYDLPYAEAIFEIGFFHQNPNPFFALAKELYPGNYQPNLTHYFVRLLHEKGQLLRMYTQNIDGLERRVYCFLSSLILVLFFKSCRITTHHWDCVVIMLVSLY